MINLNWQAPDLGADETVELRVPANLVRMGVARGGNLFLTNRRLLFQPNSVEAWLGMKPRTWAPDSIASVGVAKRGLNVFAGATKRRLKISLKDGRVLLFVVPQVDATANQIASMLGLAEA